MSNKKSWQLFWILIVIGIAAETADILIPGDVPLPSLVQLAKKVWGAL